MSIAYSALLERAEGLYQVVVTAPQDWGDAAFEEWALDIFSEGDPPPRPLAREVRRCIRAAVKLRSFWLDPATDVPSNAGDWRTRVDLALGIRAWRPLLAIALFGLDEAPTEHLFGETRRLFREVHAAPWAEGLTYAEWRSLPPSRP